MLIILAPGPYWQFHGITGQRKVMLLDRRPPMITPIMAEHQHGLEAFLERNQGVFE